MRKHHLVVAMLMGVVAAITVVASASNVTATFEP
jgi:hypothetical protein